MPINIVKHCWDNKHYKGKPNKYPHYKIILEDTDEVTFFCRKDQNGNIIPEHMEKPCNTGDKISFRFKTDRDGRKSIIFDREKGKEAFNVILDDPLPQSEKEWLASPPEQATDFNPVQYEKDAVMDKKGMIIWVQGLIQADIRAGNIKLNDVNESTLANAIDLYKKIAK
tara:strand:- start:60 stop:566 length:507 start_codon:yes stop_codon:yes gene_type:complete